MVFITIPNHKTLSLTLDPNTTTLHWLYLSQSHPLPSQNGAVLLSGLLVVLDGPVHFENRFPQPALEAQMLGYGAGIDYGVLHSILRWTRGGEVSVVEFEWGVRLGWRLGEEREIVDLGLLTQTKISKDLFLKPKSPSLFHLSNALKL